MVYGKLLAQTNIKQTFNDSYLYPILCVIEKPLSMESSLLSVGWTQVGILGYAAIGSCYYLHCLFGFQYFTDI